MLGFVFEQVGRLAKRVVRVADACLELGVDAVRGFQMRGEPAGHRAISLRPFEPLVFSKVSHTEKTRSHRPSFQAVTRAGVASATRGSGPTQVPVRSCTFVGTHPPTPEMRTPTLLRRRS